MCAVISQLCVVCCQQNSSNFRSSPAHLSGAATPNKHQGEVVDIGNLSPQGPQLMHKPVGRQSMFKPLGNPLNESINLSPQQQARNTLLKQQVYIYVPIYVPINLLSSNSSSMYVSLILLILLSLFVCPHTKCSCPHVSSY